MTAVRLGITLVAAGSELAHFVRNRVSQTLVDAIKLSSGKITAVMSDVNVHGSIQIVTLAGFRGHQNHGCCDQDVEEIHG